MIDIDTNTIFSQSHGTLIYIQFGYTAIHIGKSKSKQIRIKLFSPIHDAEKGYQCKGFGFSFK